MYILIGIGVGVITFVCLALWYTQSLCWKAEQGRKDINLLGFLH